MQPDHRASDDISPAGRTGPGSGPGELSARQETISPSNTRLHGFILALVGFLVLFLELACIRWFAANVIFLQFFTNVVFIACFLGMSCGCLTSQRRDWLARFPFLAVGTFAAAVAILVIYHYWQGLSVDVGHQPLPQEVFYGTEYRNPDVAQFVVPIELIAGLFFVLVAFLFVGLGQVLGRSFNAYPNRVRAYTWNIGGSLIGIAGFSALAVAQAPPVVWFLVVVVGIAWLLIQHHQLSWPRVAALAVLLVLVALPVVSLLNPGVGSETRWSPYYAVVYNPVARTITVDTINHQTMHAFEEPGSTTYSLIHLLQQGSGGKPFQDILIIGAGSGNDVAHALRFNPRRVDAVEIDPVIQDIGVRYHPDRPYQDPRVFRHLDDGRHFLRTTDRKYDLVVYGLVDSLILHSSYANLRLESYLFTDEAFRGRPAGAETGRGVRDVQLLPAGLDRRSCRRDGDQGVRPPARRAQPSLPAGHPPGRCLDRIYAGGRRRQPAHRRGVPPAPGILGERRAGPESRPERIYAAARYPAGLQARPLDPARARDARAAGGRRVHRRR